MMQEKQPIKPTIGLFYFFVYHATSHIFKAQQLVYIHIFPQCCSTIIFGVQMTDSYSSIYFFSLKSKFIPHDHYIYTHTHTILTSNQTKPN